MEYNLIELFNGRVLLLIIGIFTVGRTAVWIYEVTMAIKNRNDIVQFHELMKFIFF